MNPGNNSRTVWIVVGIIAALLLGCVMGSCSGGLVGYGLARRNAMRTGDAWNVRIPLIEQMQGEPVRVQQVVPDSPADKAGIRVGDEIVAAGGTPLSAEQSLAEIVERYRPGDSLELLIVRAGSQLRFQVTVGSNPETSGNQPWLGIYYR